MHRSKGTQRLLALFVACAALLSSSACGGSEDDPVATAAVFFPTASNPASGTISMQAGASNGQAFSIRVAVKDVSNLFGAAFRVTFNPNVVRFVSADSSDSVLTGAGITTQFTAAVVHGHPSELAVVATRVQNGAGTVPGVNVTDGDLVVLNFQALTTTSGTAIAFGSPLEADSCNTTTHVCSAILIPAQNWIGGTLTAN